jgi:hypothetical protein
LGHSSGSVYCGFGLCSSNGDEHRRVDGDAVVEECANNLSNSKH